MEEKIEIPERFLPIGTVVLLKEGNRPLMITSYCIYPTGVVYEKGQKVSAKNKFYDYGACTYPEGVLGANRILGFNHSQIDKVLHLGYKTEISDNISKKLNESYDTMKKDIEKVEN